MCPRTSRALDGCAISYLAIRGHINWLDALRTNSLVVHDLYEG